MPLHRCRACDRDGNCCAHKSEQNVGEHVGETPLRLVVDGFERAEQVEQHCGGDDGNGEGSVCRQRGDQLDGLAGWRDLRAMPTTPQMLLASNWRDARERKG